ncbi:nuclear transport factor 2 family protein [Mucilaginibacter lacusdianchii]|uniref:nuclear transport factor 2 family protein n=1 Tax=Mucilaginibacter lacusdianchii TaxID=2684211 RepID=UPI00131D9BAE|nr:nuclear transport factor 2 family protein [Mucilaginibacter sp. JXJ CY 39]
MKTLNSFLFAALLFISTFAAKASDKPDAAKLSKNYAINTYVSAICQGKLAGLGDVIEDCAKFSILRGNKVVSCDKEQMIKFMKENANVRQDCTTSTSVVEANADITVVKVDMQYSHFVRSNYVTLANTGNGWKITNVHSVFNKI